MWNQGPSWDSLYQCTISEYKVCSNIPVVNNNNDNDDDDDDETTTTTTTTTTTIIITITIIIIQGKKLDKCEVNFTLEEAMKAHRGSRGLALLFL
jgi:hypothetical protein